ncbi:hypothetical protein FA13DRAFT_650422 [Coprinellus micaceus]|uniref:Uncharacterized protein n=1 Tax=Coprinellus micaceus TaxID=71717 RepID=A0A4Y7T5V9_COPMI|nr:hypothetical protein FA13DRAFT_650422 [Coprinellus micaceus]
MLSIPEGGGEQSSNAVPQSLDTLRASPASFYRTSSNPSITPISQSNADQSAHSRPAGTRTQSQGSIFATTTNPSNYYNTQRSSSYPSPYSTHSSSAPSGVNQPRHIVTRAQPPSLLLSGGFGAGSAATPAPTQTPTPAQLIAQGKALPELPSAAPVQNAPDAAFNPSATSPPYSQPYIPAQQEGVRTSSVSPTLVAQHPNVINTNVTDTKQGVGFQVRNPSVSPTSPAQHAKRASVSALKNVGKKIGVATAKFVASGVSTALTGIDVTTLANALTGTSFNFSGLQAVLQAQPNADYSAAIAALQQQQLQQPSPAVDYAQLISQIQQLQALAAQQQQQQQQILAMQLANLNQSNAILAAQQQLGGLGAGAPAMTPNLAPYGGAPQQQAPTHGQAQSPPLSTNPFDYSPTAPNYSQQVPSPPIAPAGTQHAPSGHAHTPSFSQPPMYQSQPPAQQHTGPAQSPPPFTSAAAPPPSQDNLIQTLQAQQAAANQQMQAQIQQYQLAAQGQQQAMAAQIQQQSQAIQAQQQAALTQAMQQQQQIQQQQNQALLNSIVAPPPPAQGTSFTDLMSTYLNSALSGGQTDPSAVNEIPPSYSGLMSSLGLGGGSDPAAAGDISSLGISVDLSSTFGSLDLSSLTA